MHIKEKQRIYLCQVNNRFGRNIFLPYSVGLLQSYCQTDPEIRSNFEFSGFIFTREDVKNTVATMDKPSVVGISCYIWNWEFNKALAQEIKAVYPDCLIVLGGPHLPAKSDTFFKEHPYADVIVHYEGEMSFAEVLLESLSNNPDFTKIPGLSVRVGDNETYQTQPRTRVSDLSIIPSPYLTGVFDRFTSLPFSLNASQETHRGCPYSCAFCVWGRAVYTKVRAFDTERLVEEFEWCGKHRVEILYNCDANYGLLPRDYDLTVKMAEAKVRHGGYPVKFRAAYAKNSNDKVFEIARVLHKAGMNKGVTLSFQSMDDDTLLVIKRKNIKVTDFRRLMVAYRREGIATYSELILGLPNETYGTFVNGIDTLLEAGQHDSLNIYICAMLPDSEMSEPDYVKVHGIEWIHAPILQHHSTPSQDGIVEYNDVVIGTRTMPNIDWERAYIFSWAVQCFHCLGLTQQLALFLHQFYGLKYSKFYESLIDYCKKHCQSLIGQQYNLVAGLVGNIKQGSRLEIIDQRFGNITWPLEEGTFLRMMADKATFFREIGGFIKSLVDSNGFDVSEDLLSDLVKYQASIVIDPCSEPIFNASFDYNIHEYLEGAYMDEPVELKREPNELTLKSPRGFDGDLETYAREVIWYGRKGGRFHCSDVSVQSIKPQ